MLPQHCPKWLLEENIPLILVQPYLLGLGEDISRNFLGRRSEDIGSVGKKEILIDDGEEVDKIFFFYTKPL